MIWTARAKLLVKECRNWKICLCAGCKKTCRLENSLELIKTNYSKFRAWSSNKFEIAAFLRQSDWLYCLLWFFIGLKRQQFQTSWKIMLQNKNSLSLDFAYFPLISIIHDPENNLVYMIWISLPDIYRTPDSQKIRFLWFHSVLVGIQKQMIPHWKALREF